MVEINLWSGLRRFADGKDKVEVSGKTVGEILDDLVARYPGMAPVIKAGVSISVDGEIIPTGRREPVKEDSEVFLLQRLKGG
ncbi:Molybdopterin converting factor, small subunit [Shimia gijangensis]|uniref:Molybdopterin converting factor, small subunit n=1 Tax=Shimia gijangensis TaxID=1470563 RepID=A0A1M6QYX4_9RHOB|nr:MoaD/ThiS family protein [Shimia gijangensis]SHK25469.1 Molybdopterin converting factor, small subunit [Shimia gijangensis]